MRIACAWCGKELGIKKGKGVTFGICNSCAKKLEEDRKEIEKGGQDEVYTMW